MAYAPYEEEDEDGLSPMARAPGPPGSLRTKASSATPAPTAPQASMGPTQVNNPSTSGRFINFSSYFNANRPAAEGAGDRLVGDLTKEASGVESAAKSVQTKTSKDAADGTLGMPNPGTMVERAFDTGSRVGYITPELAEQKSKTVYAGPGQDNVEAAFAPLGARADTVGRSINQTTDAAGTKAVTGGTGFQAQLAHTAAGGRLGDLRQKYGGLSKAVADSKALASGAVKYAQDTTTANAAAYGKLASDFAGREKVSDENRIRREQESTKNAWNTALTNSNKYGGHIPTTGTRPGGQVFASSLPQDFANPASPLYMPPAAVAKVFDALSDADAQAVLSYDRRNGAGFREMLNNLGIKYGVK